VCGIKAVIRSSLEPGAVQAPNAGRTPGAVPPLTALRARADAMALWDDDPDPKPAPAPLVQTV
jgi:hypothetical protein